MASWRKRLGAHLAPLGSRVRVSVTPCGFRGGRNGVWVGFSRGFSRLSLPQISFHHFSTLISSISFHFISPCDGASGVVGRHPCYTRAYNIGLHRISSLNPTLCWTRVEDIYLFIHIRRHLRGWECRWCKSVWDNSGQWTFHFKLLAILVSGKKIIFCSIS